ncbi:MAG TPA: ABC transporter permease [Candidatus Acidoferrales bacterium]|nr:ABC transporter permease [Candidatus Acidoferrales bacterium]
MRKLWIVIRREYMVRVRTRTFVLSTVGLPLLLVAAFLIPAYVASRHTGHTSRIAIVDEVGGMAPAVEQGLARVKLPNRAVQFDVVSTIDRPADPGHVLGQLREQVRRGELDGYLVLPRDVLTDPKAEYYTRNPGDFSLTDDIGTAITNAAIGGRLTRQNLRVSDMEALLRLVKVNVVKISREGGETVERGQTFQAVVFLAVILYTSLLMYGVATMRSILEEKSTRIMEILLSSVRPFQLLAGKILGVGAVGFTQFLIWGIAAAGVFGYGAAMSPTLGSNDGFHLHFPGILWMWFAIYFLGGYFLYASLYAAVGAATSNEQDANQIQMPITILLVLCFTMFPVLVRNPGSNTSILLTMIPFFSPILMVLRIALETPPLWQILASVALLILATVAVVYVSAKIYRVGVLMYGKRPSVVELVRWLRYS